MLKKVVLLNICVITAFFQDSLTNRTF